MYNHKSHAKSDSLLRAEQELNYFAIIYTFKISFILKENSCRCVHYRKRVYLAGYVLYLGRMHCCMFQHLHCTLFWPSLLLIGFLHVDFNYIRELQQEFVERLHWLELYPFLQNFPSRTNRNANTSMKFVSVAICRANKLLLFLSEDTPVHSCKPYERPAHSRYDELVNTSINLKAARRTIKCCPMMFTVEVI